MTGETKELEHAIARLNARAWGIAGAMVLGVGLFLATNILLLKGAPPGQHVGPTLNRLSYFLPGYSVSFVGSVIGLVYGWVIGYAVGRVVGTLYNRMVR